MTFLQTFPFFGVVPAILNESGEELEGPSEGYLVLFLIAPPSSCHHVVFVVVIAVVVLMVSTCSDLLRCSSSRGPAS